MKITAVAPASWALATWLVIGGALSAHATAADGAVRVVDAARQGDARAVNASIDAGSDVNVAEADGTTALHWAVHRGDAGLVARLLGAGANVNARNRYGVSPLMIAAINGSAPSTAALLKAGADVKAATLPEGETVLMTAARAGAVAVVRLLLESPGVEVDARESWYGETALMLAAGQRHAEVVGLLAGRGADVNAQSTTFSKADRGAAFSTVIRGGFTPLLFAAREGSMEVVDTLLPLGADLNLPDPDGVTPLLTAIINAHYDVAERLIEKGADINRVDSVGRGPLFAAVDMHTIEWTPNRPPPKPTGRLDALGLVTLLLERGANPDARLTGQAPARKGDSYPDPVLIAGATSFLRAAKGADLAVLRLLLDRGADPNLAIKNGTTPLMAGAGVYWRDASSRAVEADAVETIKLCLALGADVNAVNEEKKTALHGAAARGSNALVQLLVDSGANLFAKNGKGHTPLDEAVVGGNYSNGATGERHPEQPHTAALLRQLMAAAGAKARPAMPGPNERPAAP